MHKNWKNYTKDINIKHSIHFHMLSVISYHETNPVKDLILYSLLNLIFHRI